MEPSLLVEFLICFQFLFLAFQGVQSFVDIFQQFFDFFSFTLYGKVIIINQDIVEFVLSVHWNLIIPQVLQACTVLQHHVLLLADSCILARVTLHISARVNVVLLTYLIILLFLNMDVGIKDRCQLFQLIIPGITQADLGCNSKILLQRF